MEDYLTKPLRVDDLECVLPRYLPDHKRIDGPVSWSASAKKKGYNAEIFWRGEVERRRLYRAYSQAVRLCHDEKDQVRNLLWS